MKKIKDPPSSYKRPKGFDDVPSIIQPKSSTGNKKVNILICD